MNTLNMLLVLLEALEIILKRGLPKEGPMEKCKLKDDKCNFFYLDELRADIYVDIFLVAQYCSLPRKVICRLMPVHFCSKRRPSFTFLNVKKVLRRFY